MRSRNHCPSLLTCELHSLHANSTTYRYFIVIASLFCVPYFYKEHHHEQDCRSMIQILLLLISPIRVMANTNRKTKAEIPRTPTLVSMKAIKALAIIRRSTARTTATMATSTPTLRAIINTNSPCGRAVSLNSSLASILTDADG